MKEQDVKTRLESALNAAMLSNPNVIRIERAGIAYFQIHSGELDTIQWMAAVFNNHQVQAEVMVGGDRQFGQLVLPLNKLIQGGLQRLENSVAEIKAELESGNQLTLVHPKSGAAGSGAQSARALRG